MPFELSSIAALSDLPFDEIIDVRSPAEFADDHIPGAINLPVLNNDERARVGTMYVQDSPFNARKLGAALVSRNAARHLEGTLADKPKGYRPLVYCWRGGQRSGSFTVILQQIGWQADTITGGYRQYRRLVQTALYDTPFPCRAVVLEGNTGTAKTDLLPLLEAQGQQVLDLEGLANHRGSLFGAMGGGQPSQKMFETRLALAMRAFDPNRAVIVEGESSKIGDLGVPPKLWEAMKTAPRLVVKAPRAERAQYLARRYRDVTEDAARLRETLMALAPLHPSERIEDWVSMADQADFADLAEGLMRDHYDPRYEKQRSRFDALDHETVSLDRLAPDALAASVPGLISAINRLCEG